MIVKLKYRRVLVFALYMIFLTLLQALWPSAFTLSFVKPDFQMVYAILVGYVYLLQDGLLCALIMGFMRDILAGQVFGFGMFFLCLVVVCAHYALRNRLSQNLFSYALVVMVLTILFDLLFLGIQMILALTDHQYHYLVALPVYLTERLIPQLIFNLTTGIVIFGLSYYLGPYPRKQQKAWLNNRENRTSSI